MKIISKHITVNLQKIKKRKNLASDQRETVEFSKKEWKSEASRMTSSKFSKKVVNYWFWLDSHRNLELIEVDSTPSVSHPILGFSLD